MAKVVIIGAGQGGRLVLSILKRFNPENEIVGFLDDGKIGKTIDGVKVIGGTKDFANTSANSFIVGIGCSNLKARAELFEKAKKAGLKPINAINPTALIDESAKIGKGVTIFPGVVINKDAVVGDNVTIYSGVVIEHECEIGNHVYIGPGAHLSGTVKVGEGTFIGVGANFIQDLKIGKNSVIGAGAVVLENVPDNVVYAGVPGKVLRKRGKEEVGV